MEKPAPGLPLPGAERHGRRSVGVITSSRCTNEETYLVQKLTRAVFLNNNTDTCARVCHSPTGYGLGKTFGTSESDAAVTAPMAYNQGFYNLFLAIITAVGIVLLGSDHGTGTALALAGTGSMLGAALVLVTHDRTMARSAITQGLFPALAVVFLLVWWARHWLRDRRARGGGGDDGGGGEPDGPEPAPDAPTATAPHPPALVPT